MDHCRILNLGPTLLLLCCFLPGCLDQIDLASGPSQNVLIVDARVHNGIGWHFVKLKHSAPLAAGPDGVQIPVIEAQVHIIDDLGLQFELEEGEPGIYFTDDLQGVPGRAYQLLIETDFGAYQSSWELMPRAPSIGRLDYQLHKDVINDPFSINIVTQNNITVLVDSDLTGTNQLTFVRFRVEGSYEFMESNSNIDVHTCYVNEVIDLGNIAIVSSSDLNDGQLIQFPILTKEIDYRFAFSYCFTVVLESITERAYQFWQTVDDEYERTGDIFESSPASIPSNISKLSAESDPVLGLFSALSVDTAYMIIRSTEVEGPGSICYPQFRPPTKCVNCLTIAKSSYGKTNCFMNG